MKGTYACTDICRHMCEKIYAHVQSFAAIQRACVYMHIYICICVHSCTYMHICIYPPYPLKCMFCFVLRSFSCSSDCGKPMRSCEAELQTRRAWHARPALPQTLGQGHCQVTGKPVACNSGRATFNLLCCFQSITGCFQSGMSYF